MAQVVRWVVVAICGLGLVAAASAHNNPGFREVWLLSVEVLAAPLQADRHAYSEPFAFDLPKKSIELIWRIDGEDVDRITFSVAKDGEVVAQDLTNGANSRIMRGEGYVIVDVTGTKKPFTLQVFANVIDRLTPPES